MDFTSLQFLFLFLPLLYVIFVFTQGRLRPVLLLLFSLIFIAWGRVPALYAYFLLIGGNFFLAQWIEKSPGTKWALVIGIGYNVTLYLFYKTFSLYPPVWLVHMLEPVIPDALETDLLNLVYPIGLSYIILQMISYLVDVSRGVVSSEKNLINFAFYGTFFLKILTGPITLYRTVRKDLEEPNSTASTQADGLRRFAIGLIKKVLIADQLAKITNPAFNLPTPNFLPYIAWLSIIAFTLQIYYDFSGYSDMAIGLGRVFGLVLPENFNQPFSSRSIGELWRRWHMTLSAWFREYIFYPLERHRFPAIGQQLNILLVFILTGLWHGLTANYAIWGFIHGSALALESTRFGSWLKNVWRPIQTIYVITITAFAFIFFRSNSLAYAWAFIKRLGGDMTGITPLPFSLTRPLPFIDPTTWIALVLGILLQVPIGSYLGSWIKHIREKSDTHKMIIRLVTDLLILGCFWLGIAVLVSGGFTPGIYDKF